MLNEHFLLDPEAAVHDVERVADRNVMCGAWFFSAASGACQWGYQAGQSVFDAKGDVGVTKGRIRRCTEWHRRSTVGIRASHCGEFPECGTRLSIQESISE
jgi:hypothetical protein